MLFKARFQPPASFNEKPCINRGESVSLSKDLFNSQSVAFTGTAISGMKVQQTSTLPIQNRWLPYLPFLLGIAVLSCVGMYVKISRHPKIQPGYISTFAGIGLRSARHPGEYDREGPAAKVKLWKPVDVIVDGDDDVYLADANRVEKITPKGWLKEVAGTNSPGFSGDRGPSTHADLNQPQSLALDPFGNLYIADSRNYRIRRVDRKGRIQTVAGNGRLPFTHPKDRKSDEGKSAIACPLLPSALACDAQGTLYVVEKGMSRVRKIDRNGILTTVAGTGIAGFSGDGGPATQARLNGPGDVTIDTWGNLYIADTENKRIRRVDPRGIITTFAGTIPTTDENLNVDEESIQAGYIGEDGPALSAQFYGPSALTTDAEGNLFLVDGYWVRKIGPNGVVTTVAGMKSARAIPTGSSDGTFMDGVPATDVWLIEPTAIALNGKGDLLIAEMGTRRIRKVPAIGGSGLIAGRPLSSVASP